MTTDPTTDQEQLAAAAAEMSRDLGREVTPEVCEVAARVVTACERDDFPTLKGKPLTLRTSMPTIIMCSELALKLEGGTPDAVAAAIHAAVSMAVEQASKGRRFSPKRREVAKS